MLVLIEHSNFLARISFTPFSFLHFHSVHLFPEVLSDPGVGCRVSFTEARNGDGLDRCTGGETTDERLCSRPRSMCGLGFGYQDFGIISSMCTSIHILPFVCWKSGNIHIN